MKNNIKRTYRIIRNQWYRIALLSAIYKIIFFLLIVPFISLGINFALKFTRYSYITTENIFKFISYPQTICILILTVLIGSVAVLMETASLFFLFEDCKNKKSLNVIQLLIAGLKSVFSCFRRRDFMLPLYALCMSFLLNIPTILLALSNHGIPSYLMKRFLGLHFIKPFLVIVLVAILILAYRRVFILPICILDKKRYKEAKKISIQHVKQLKLRFVGQILLINAILVIVYLLVFVCCLSVLVLGINLFVNKRIAIPLFLQNYGQLKTIVFAGGSVLATVVNYCMISTLYTRISKPNIQELDEVQGKKVKLRLQDNIRKRMKRIGIALICLCGITAYSYFYNMMHNGVFRAEESLLGMQITAHRGDSKEAPENTLPSIQSAIDSLADYAEIDVQLTKDGVVVLCHDSSLYRTGGVKAKVSNLNYAQVLEYDVGSWFSEEFSGTKVPTLAEVLELCKGKIKLNIELKRISKQHELVEKVVALIHQYEFERQCVITSMSHEALSMVKEEDQTLRTGYIMSLAYGNFYENPAIDFFSMKASIVTEDIVVKAHKFGKEVHAWTVNSKNEITRLSAIGVDNIITDRPVYVQQVLYDVKETSLLQYVRMILK